MKRKKRKLNVKGKLVLFLFSCILCSIFGFGIYSIYFHDRGKEQIQNNSLEQKNLKKEKEDHKHLSLIMVGDNLIHDKIYREAKTNDGYDFRKMYSLIKPIVKKYDLAYYNQETILGGEEIGVSSYPAFNSPYEVGDAMIDAGFNLVSLATNHTLDRGEKAVLNSRNYWNGKDNVLAVGSYGSEVEKEKTEVREVNGIRYTLLNYTYGTNGISVPSGKDYLVNIWPVTGNHPSMDEAYQNYKLQVKKDIDAVRDNVDVLMVAMHFGVEYQYAPNDYQKDMAQYLASLGVHIVIGTHPHVIQPVTWIGDTLVIYSLGNFISAHEVVNLGNRIGLMSSLDIDKTGDKIKISNVKHELLYTYYTSNYKDFLVVPFSMMKEDYLKNYKDVYEEYKSIVQKLDRNQEVIPFADE